MNSRNYGASFTRHLVTGKIRTEVEWCAVDPRFPVQSAAQVWMDSPPTVSDRVIVKRVKRTTTSYITEVEAEHEQVPQ